VDGSFARALSRRRAVEMRQPLATDPGGIAQRPLVDLNRPADRTQLQFVADANATLFGQRLWQGDLQLSGYLGHDSILALVKDDVKDQALIPRHTKAGIQLDVLIALVPRRPSTNSTHPHP
jgi:hypothetical protein